MSRFSFSLQSLLELRKRQEQEHQQHVAALQRRRYALEDSLRRQQHQVEDARSQLRRRLVGTLDAEDVRRFAAAAVQEQRQIQRILPELGELHRKIEGAQRVLLEAARRRKALERLREQKFAEWRAAQLRQEGRILDDLAATSAWKEDST